MSKVSENCWKALALIRKGWTKSRWSRLGRAKNGEFIQTYCAVGALEMAITGQVWKGSARDSRIVDESDALWATAKELFPDRCYGLCSIMDFNDHSMTTQEDIELVFEKTAIKYDEVLGD